MVICSTDKCYFDVLAKCQLAKLDELGGKLLRRGVAIRTNAMYFKKVASDEK